MSQDESRGIDLASIDQPPELRARWAFRQREKNSVVLKAASACARAAEHLLHSTQISSSDVHGVTRLILCTRLIASLDALSVLASFGFVTEAKAIYRTMLDAASRMIALCKFPDLLDDYLAQDPRDQLRAMEDLRSLQGLDKTEPAKPSAAELAAVEAEARANLDALEQSAGRKLKKKNDWEWAKAAGMEAIFWAHWGSHSQAVHHSPRDLTRHVIRGADGALGVRSGPEVERVDLLLLDGSLLVLSSIGAFATCYSIDVDDSLCQLDVRIRELHAERYGWSTGIDAV